MPIAREQATEIAEDYLGARLDKHPAYRIWSVTTSDKIRGRKPAPYLVGPERLEDCWIVYLERVPGLPVICSSTIMLVSKADGRVVYFGSAADEG